MNKLDQTIESYAVTSRLIDLIIQLPERDQRILLRSLEEQILEMENNPAGNRSGIWDDYADDRYIYWDLFKPH